MSTFKNMELWWVTGAQLLYGGDTVKIVDGHSKEMVDGLNQSGNLPIKVVYKSFFIDFLFQRTNIVKKAMFSHRLPLFFIAYHVRDNS